MPFETLFLAWINLTKHYWIIFGERRGLTQSLSLRPAVWTFLLPHQRTRLPMLVLFDHGTPRSIARFLIGHTVAEAKAKGWDRLSNGELLKTAEEAGFEVLLTTDKNIQYQQNLTGRRIAIVVLGNPQRPVVHRHMDQVVTAVNAALPGSYLLVEMSDEANNA